MSIPHPIAPLSNPNGRMVQLKHYLTLKMDIMCKIVKVLRICFLLFLFFWSVRASLAFINTANRQWNPHMLNQDAASEWERRLRGIQDDLPRQGMVGYVSEQDYPGIIYSATDQDEEFSLSQYALAPLILDRGNTHHELVIGNFAGETNYQFEAVLGLKLIHNYGYGIYLFEGSPE